MQPKIKQIEWTSLNTVILLDDGTVLTYNGTSSALAGQTVYASAVPLDRTERAVHELEKGVVAEGMDKIASDSKAAHEKMIVEQIEAKNKNQAYDSRELREAGIKQLRHFMLVNALLKTAERMAMHKPLTPVVDLNTQMVMEFMREAQTSYSVHGYTIRDSEQKLTTWQKLVIMLAEIDDVAQQDRLHELFTQALERKMKQGPQSERPAPTPIENDVWQLSLQKTHAEEKAKWERFNAPKPDLSTINKDAAPQHEASGAFTKGSMKLKNAAETLSDHVSKLNPLKDDPRVDAKKCLTYEEEVAKTTAQAHDYVKRTFFDKQAESKDEPFMTLRDVLGGPKPTEEEGKALLEAAGQSPDNPVTYEEDELRKRWPAHYTGYVSFIAQQKITDTVMTFKQYLMMYHGMNGAQLLVPVPTKSDKPAAMAAAVAAIYRRTIVGIDQGRLVLDNGTRITLGSGAVIGIDNTFYSLK